MRSLINQQRVARLDLEYWLLRIVLTQLIGSESTKKYSN